MSQCLGASVWGGLGVSQAKLCVCTALVARPAGTAMRGDRHEVLSSQPTAEPALLAKAVLCA